MDVQELCCVLKRYFLFNCCLMYKYMKEPEIQKSTRLHHALSEPVNFLFLERWWLNFNKLKSQ